MSSFSTRLADSPCLCVGLILIVLASSVLHTVHCAIIAKAGSSPCAATWTLVMPCQRVSTRKFPTTLVACVRPLASMQFRVSLQIM
ncbi:hypothetical protein KC327_g16 [Hortaea werneckii]|nr:hypothetical protein KC327_g16 [Hortaea werneckii]